MQIVPMTVHMIVRNEEQWVWYALQSVLPFAARLLVYDTGSTDQTVAIIRTIKDKKIVFAQKKEIDANGLVSVRNEQIEKTKTDWFLLVDGDEVWPAAALREHLQLAAVSQPRISAIVSPTRMCVGDLYHVQDARAGAYTIADNSGHYNIRLYRKKAGYTWQGTYPLEAYTDADGVAIQDKPRNLLTATRSYWHLSHLPRSLVDTHRKRAYEVGIKDEVPLPTVFGKKRPKIVPSPDVGFTTLEWLYALVRTPFVYVKRRLFS